MDIVFAFHVDPYVFWQYPVGEMARQGVEELLRSNVSKMRHWRMTALGKRRPRAGFRFTLMTYNVLSQTALQHHLHLYRHCDPRHLDEEHRLSKILPEILASGSDVVCLQEVEQALFERRMRAALDARGFGALFKRRTGDKSDGCAILWRRDAFSLEAHREVEMRVRGCALLDRDNVGLIAVLRPRHPRCAGARLHVATAHLLFNPRRGDVKLCQLRLLLAELARSALRGPGRREYDPAVLCGDFNFEPHSPLYRFVESGRLDVSGLLAGDLSGQREGRRKGGPLDAARLSLDALGIDGSGRFAQSGDSSSSSSSSSGCEGLFFHDLDLSPAYKFRQGGGQCQRASCLTGRDCSAVDHIFFGEEGALRLLGVYGLPLADELRDLGGLPNALLGSDHLSLVSKFLIDPRR